MKNIFLSILYVLLLSECGKADALSGIPQPKFQVVVYDGEKIQAKNTTIIGTIDNRLTNKIQDGGVYVDNKGLFIDFTKAIYDKNTSSMNDYITVIVTNKEDTSLFDFRFYGPMHEILFLIDGNNKEAIEIILNKNKNDRKIGELKYIEYEDVYAQQYSEWAIGVMKLKDFIKLMNFKTLDVKIVGAERNRIIENNIIQSDFKEHLKQFYDEIEKFKQY